MGGTTVELSIKDGIATITLVPPAPTKPPTMDLPFFDALESALERLESALNPSESGDEAAGAPPREDLGGGPPRVLHLRSSSERYFCAGGDIAVLETLNAKTMGPWVERGHNVLARLEELPLPTIAVVEGFALGGGLELALACDLVVAEEGARVGLTETGLGFVPGWGGSVRLARRIGKAQAKRLIFTASSVTAEEAEVLGMVDFAGAPTKLADYVADISDRIKQCSPKAVAAAKRILTAADGGATSPRSAMQADRKESLLLVEDADTVRRLREFLEARKKAKGAGSAAAPVSRRAAAGYRRRRE